MVLGSVDGKQNVVAAKPECSNRFEELDALRGLCAVTVAVSHFYLAFCSASYIRPFLGSATIAVYVFFIMSGHVVNYRYLQDGAVESLLSAAFRRVPRLVLPALWANLIYWMLAMHGAFGAEEEWRRIRTQYFGKDDNWCRNCFPTDLGVVVESSFQVMWSFKVESFAWLWTIPHEIFGSAMVFLLAPIFRAFVNFGLEHDCTDDLVPVLAGRHLWPRKLLRCLSAHGVFLLLVFVVGQLVSHCSDVTGALAPGSWCDGFMVVNAQRWMVGLCWRTVFLFELGLASAHVRAIMGTQMNCGSWRDEFLHEWNEQWSTKWVLPASLICFGMGASTVPVRNALVLGPQLSVVQTGLDFYLFGAAAIFLGVILCPKQIRDALARVSVLGNMAFSMYLLHMGVIWTIGMPVYVWLDGNHHLSGYTKLVLTTAICAGPLFFFSHMFWLAIEEPLGVRLPQLALAWLKWLVRESWKPQQAEEEPKLSLSMNEALYKVDEILASATARMPVLDVTSDTSETPIDSVRLQATDGWGATNGMFGAPRLHAGGAESQG